MKQDLYDTLKVPKNASQEVIKKAFRRRAKRTHPDMGGSAEEFNDVKTAYLVLINDETRKEYDETGQYSQTKADDIESRARQTMIALFVKIITHHGENITRVDIFKEMRDRITIIEREMNNRIEQVQKTIARLDDVRSRMKYVGKKDNFLLPVIEDQIGKANREIRDLEKELKMGEIVKDLIKGYVFRADPNFAPNFNEIRSFSFITSTST